MRNMIFKPEQFVPTQYATAKDKADFANALARFVKGGFRRTMFPKKLYTRLSMCFGHIAHYDINGFYSEWFEDCPANWIWYIRNHHVIGNPEFTFSDVERAFQEWLAK